MEQERPQVFGGIRQQGSDRKVYLLVLPVVLALLALVGWAVVQGARAGSSQRALAAASQQNEELQKELANRDALVADASRDDTQLRSPGQASALFVAAGPGATESGIAVSDPEQRTVKVFLYGLVQPPQGQEYVVAATPPNGPPQPLGSLVVNPQGNAFLLAKDVPEGTTRIDVMFRPAGEQGMDRATPRVSARHPTAKEERGILPQEPQPARRAQARRGR